MSMQSGWRWCRKCESLYYSRNPSPGACAAGGTHDSSQSGAYSFRLAEGQPGVQGGWRWCAKCQVAFYTANPGQGVCPAGGAHDGGRSGHYSTPIGDVVPHAQAGWRWCRKCQGLFFGGHPQHQGRCPAGGQHDQGGSAHYAVFSEVTPLGEIICDWPSITFRSGVPVGGNSKLSLYPNGDYYFSGHFHDSGFPSYDLNLVFAVKSAVGTVLTFVETGRTHGTIDPGSRDYDWVRRGNSADVAAIWDDLSASYLWRGHAAVDLNLVTSWQNIKAAIGVVSEVISVVGPIVATVS